MGFTAFERMVALRYLRARREEGFVSVIAFLSLISIMVGVAALIIVMSVLNGFRAELLDRVFGLNGQLAIEATDRGPLKDYAALRDRIQDTPGVVRVVPVVEGQVMISAGNISRGAMVRGVSLRQLQTRPIIANNLREGSLDDLAGGDGILLGARFAARLGVGPGDLVRLASPRGDVQNVGTLPLIRAYRVAALFHIGMSRYDNGYVFMPLAAARGQFETGDGVTKLEVFLADPERADQAQKLLNDRIGTAARVVHWRDLNAALFTALEVERVATFAIVAMIILVAAFNIVSGMTMLVKDKGADIAILRTVGATSGMVMRIFLLAGASIGTIGTVLGFGLGLAIAANIESLGQWLIKLPNAGSFAAEISFLANMPSRVDFVEVAVVVGLSLVLSFSATLYPAWRAARLDPVEALRYA